MKASWVYVTFLAAAVLGATHSLPQSQAQSQNLEQQIRSQYRPTRVGGNGVVVGESGSVLVLQQDGLKAIPASYGPYWYSSFKNGHIRGSAIQHGGSVGMSDLRPLQVGEKLYLVNMEINQAEIVFYVQSCGTCDASSADPNDPPYRARLAIQFDKGYQTSSDFKQVQSTIGQVFGVEAVQGRRVQVPQTPAPPAAIPSISLTLKFPATFVSAQAPTDQLQLNANNSFSLQEGGQAYHGNFTVTGNSLELTISESNTKTTATFEGNKLTDSSGQVWTLREQSAASPSSDTLLHNEDIIKMAQARFDDGIIIAKINGSKCQFDTSVDALIGLQKAGVSSAVIKAMVGAGK